MLKILIMIPAYNEEANIVAVVESLKKICPWADYIVINDGSKDNTAKICREHGFHMLDLPVNLGLSGGFQAGMRYAYQNGYDAALQFDGDGQHDPRYVEKMVQAMEEGGYDIVIGSRFVDRKKPWTARMMGSRLIAASIKITSGKTIKDPTSGMRLFRSTVLKEFAESMNFGPEPDTICYLLRRGASICEVQVEMHERMGGVSYLNLSRSFMYMMNIMVSILFIQWFRKGKK